MISILIFKRWCPGRPSNTFGRKSLSWTYSKCVQVIEKSKKKCLNDIPCRTGEIDSGANVGIQPPQVFCEYKLDSNIQKTNTILPIAWETLEDNFVLHENAMLLSKNNLYQLRIVKGNLVLYYVNIIIIK